MILKFFPVDFRRLKCADWWFYNPHSSRLRSHWPQFSILIYLMLRRICNAAASWWILKIFPADFRRFKCTDFNLILKDRKAVRYNCVQFTSTLPFIKVFKQSLEVTDYGSVCQLRRQQLFPVRNQIKSPQYPHVWIKLPPLMWITWPVM